MLVVLFGLGVAAASILGGLGRFLDASKPHLPMNFDVSKHASQKRSPCNKTTVFAMFYKLRNMPHTATKHVCMAGGDVVLRHNALRDITYDQSRAGYLRPEREASNLLNRPDDPGEPCRRRPADVLLHVWPGPISAGKGAHKVALDFAVINALGPGHRLMTAASSGTAAAAKYAQSKLTFENTEARCAENGIVLKPVVWTAQGGIDPNGAKALEALHRAVSCISGAKLGDVRREFNVKVSVALIKANARAVRRRDPDGHSTVEVGQSRINSMATAALIATHGLANDVQADGGDRSSSADEDAI